MKTQNSFSKAISSVALMAAFAIAIMYQAALTANAQIASTDSMAQGKTAGIVPLPFPTPLFTTASLKGTYGWNSVAFVNSSTSQPAAGAGLMVFDGQGNISGHYSGNFLGTPITQDYKGTYSVNPDGSGHLEFVQNNGAVLDYDLFIVSGGNEIFLVSTAVGTLQVVDVKKQ
jgi:hypothetical protein